jgi:hypothetical protein
VTFQVILDVLGAPWFLGSLAVMSVVFSAVPLAMLRRRDRLCYAVWGVWMLDSGEMFRKKLRRVRGAAIAPIKAVAWLSIWNDGRTALRNSDFPGRDPLRIVAPTGRLCPGVQLVEQSDPAAGWQICEHDGVAKLSFDLLNPREGAVLRLEHTGSWPKSIVLIGTLANVGHPVRLADADSLAGKVASYGWLVYILFGFGIVIAGVLTFGTGSPVTPGLLAIWVLGDIAPAYFAYRYSDVRMVVPKSLMRACVGLPELETYERVPIR